MSGVKCDIRVGDCRLILGDCLEVMPEIGPFDLAVTDPPYKMEIHGRGFAAKRDYYKALDYGTHTDFKLSDAFYADLFGRLNEVNALFFCNKNLKHDIISWALSAGYTFDEIAELYFCKSSPPPLTNNQWRPDKELAVHIFRGLPVRGSYKTKRTWHVTTNFKNTDVEHPSSKPVDMIRRVLENIAAPGAHVFDPFMGSASTAIACMGLGLKFTGIEIDPVFFEQAVARVRAASEAAPLLMEASV